VILAVAAVFGLLLGSFANVLIARIPDGRSVVGGRSACMSCGHQIAWYDNIPLVSWLVLRGRCRHCKAPIGWLYPVVEASVAILCVASAWKWGASVTTLLFCVLATATVALVVIDIKHRRLPHRIVLPTIGIVAVLAIAAWLLGERQSWWSALLGAVALGGFYAVLWFVYPKGMGFGDVTTAVLIGFAAGFLGYPELAVAAIAGPLVGGVVVIILALAGKAKRGVAVPYGPALLAGGWLGILAGPAIAAGYLGVLGVS
jgi:leader peptidase (prepilin peptidase)/N-methyltransferase